jgi:hypothetical protein
VVKIATFAKPETVVCNPKRRHDRHKTDKNEKTSQRFSKTKRGAAYRTKPTHCTTFAFAQPHNDDY